jgi:hypothetical protein
VHQEYTVYPELGHATIIEKHPDLSWTVYVGALGMPGEEGLGCLNSPLLIVVLGQTAFVGWKEYSDAKPVRFHSLDVRHYSLRAGTSCVCDHRGRYAFTLESIMQLS